MKRKEIQKNLKQLEEKTGESRVVYLHEDHHAPVTRRDFLSSGLLSFGGYLAAPSLLSLILGEQQAMAASSECASTSASTLPAFVHVNLSGGAGLAGNILPLDLNGNLLPSYSKLGSGDAPSVIRMMNNVALPSADGLTVLGKFFEGLQATVAQSTLDKTAFVGMCTASTDDTANNPWDVSGMISQAGLQGTILPNLGTRNSSTGIGQIAGKIPPPPPLIVKNFNDIVSSLAPTGALARLDSKQKAGVVQLIGKLSDSQTRKLASTSSSATLQKYLHCANEKNIELSNMPDPGVDPRTNADVSGVWGINANSTPQTREVFFAALVYNALQGKSGTAGLELGGYDYHGGTRTNTDASDRTAGVTVGRVIETAAKMNRPVFVVVTSDGSVSSNDPTPGGQWTGDFGPHGIAYMFGFDPSGRPATLGTQVGGFTASGQVVDTKFITGGDVSRAAQAIFCNYVKFAKQGDALIEKVLPRAFTSDEKNLILKFA